MRETAPPPPSIPQPVSAGATDRTAFTLASAIPRLSVGVLRSSGRELPIGDTAHRSMLQARRAAAMIAQGEAKRNPGLPSPLNALKPASAGDTW